MRSVRAEAFALMQILTPEANIVQRCFGKVVVTTPGEMADTGSP